MRRKRERVGEFARSSGTYQLEVGRRAERVGGGRVLGVRACPKVQLVLGDVRVRPCLERGSIIVGHVQECWEVMRSGVSIRRNDQSSIRM